MFAVRRRQEVTESQEATYTPSMFVRTHFRIPDKESGQMLPFNFKGQPYYRDIYDAQYEALLLMSGRQVGKTTAIGNMALTAATTRDRHQALYVSPTEVQTSEFSKTRLRTVIEDSPYLRTFLDRKHDAETYKRFLFTESIIRLRYAYHNADRCRGLTTDDLIIDEIQDILADNIPVIEQAQFTSKRKRRLYSGTPKSDENTLSHYWYNYSTQGEWVVPCFRHSFINWNIIGEENVPDRAEDKLVCAKCKRSINPADEMAHWVHANPEPKVEIPFFGFRIPQLITPFVDWREVIDAKKLYSRARFLNEKCGLPYAGGLRPISRDQLRAACDEDTTTGKEHRQRNQTWFTERKMLHSFAGIDWGCYSEDTRTLTNRGFKFIHEITDDDLIAQVDPDTREVEYVKPLKKTVFHHKGEMVAFKSNNVDMLVTTDHKMSYWMGGNSRRREGSALEAIAHSKIILPQLGLWHGAPEPAEFELPAVDVGNGWRADTHVPARRVPMDAWLELVGWLVSEGGVYNVKGKPAFVVITQRERKFPGRAARIRALLAELGLNFGEYYYEPTGDRQFKIYGKQIWSWVVENIGRKCYEKRIPRQFMDLSPRQLNLIFASMMEGDGSWDKRHTDNGKYSTSSELLADDVQELAFKLGYCVKRVVQAEAIGNKRKKYAVLLSPPHDRTLAKHNFSVVPYDGVAYCFTVPSGYFVTERNGCIALQGNSGEAASFTYIVVGGYYGGDDLRVSYYHRFHGEELEPIRQVEVAQEIIEAYGCQKIVADYGGGMDRNDQLLRLLGPKRFFRLQYVKLNALLQWDFELGRFIGRRTELMSMVFEAIKRKQIILPRWDEIEGTLAKEVLSCTTEITSRGDTIYNHAPNNPDDGMHSLVYMTVASTLSVPRPDFVIPVVKPALDTSIQIGREWANMPMHGPSLKHDDFGF